jgi:hypothetical protein
MVGGCEFINVVNSGEQRAAVARVEGGDVGWWWSPSADRVGWRSYWDRHATRCAVMPGGVSEVGCTDDGERVRRGLMSLVLDTDY